MAAAIRRAGLAAMLLAAVLAPASADEMAPEARAELAAAIDALKSHHMNRAAMDWPALEADAWRAAKDARSAADAYPAIRALIGALHEKHTQLQPADFVQAYLAEKPQTFAAVQSSQPPDALPLAGGIGYLLLPPHQGNEARGRAYVGALHGALRKFAKAHVCRFIVDLRRNTGGNMYPMIGGLVPLLGVQPYGFWDRGSGPNDPWMIGVDGAEAMPDLSHAAVAVLLGDMTASSGEFTAMAFEGRANTRFFGGPSVGVVTVNKPYRLPDGALLLVSEGWATDRLKRPYRGALTPDEQTEPGQPTLDAAMAWLRQQRCR